MKKFKSKEAELLQVLKWYKTEKKTKIMIINNKIKTWQIKTKTNAKFLYYSLIV